MKTIAVVSRKGGAGKTTLAVNLALCARAAGLKALLADADPLRSASQVLRRRREASPLHVETSAAKLYTLRLAALRSGVDLLVIDTPAAPEADLAEAIRIADLCVVVTRPSWLDLIATAQAAGIADRLQTPSVTVLNQCAPTRAGREPPAVARALAVLAEMRQPVAPVLLRTRAAYQTALGQGGSILETAHGSAAAVEAQTLFAELWRTACACRGLVLKAS